MLSKAQDDDLVINLVELALRCPSTERADYVERVCAGDPDQLYLHLVKAKDRDCGGTVRIFALLLAG